MTLRPILFAAIAAAAVSPAGAQLLGPEDPLVRTVGAVTGTVDGALPDRLALGEAARVSLRRQQIAILAHDHPDEIVLDPKDEPAIRGEALAVSPSEEALAAAEAEGFEIARRTRLDELGVSLVVLRAPKGMSTRRAIRRLEKLDPQGTYDYNHVYLGSGAVGAAAAGAPAKAPSRPAGSVRVGLVDGGVETTHAAFAGLKISQRAFAGEGPVATAHGTAAAALIAGRDGDFEGAAPGASLYAADIFGGAPTGGSVDAIAAAFGWFASEGVAVVNASLVGPDNAGLRVVIRAALSKGMIIVAAVGNDGPSAPPLYPASYEGVIGVTAVDRKKRAIVEAARGEQVDFAAPGADMAAAGLDNGYYEVRGTSFAAPIVTGLIAARLASGASAADALAAEAEDLGKKGRDKTYGDGLVGEALRVSPKAFAAKEGE